MAKVNERSSGPQSQQRAQDRTQVAPAQIVGPWITVAATAGGSAVRFIATNNTTTIQIDSC